jgi:hypothetical protein
MIRVHVSSGFASWSSGWAWPFGAVDAEALLFRAANGTDWQTSSSITVNHPSSRLDTTFFRQERLMVWKPRAPAMSKEAMRQASERLVREAMARNVAVTPGKTRLDVKCRKCGRA